MSSEAKLARDGHYDRRILVTGGAGFIGSHVVMLLVRKYPNYKIVNFDKLDYCSSLKNLEPIAEYPNYSFVKGSITSADLVNYVLRVEQIDTIMNFAAQTHVDNSFGNSLGFTETNILGTHVLLEAAKTSDQMKLFIHVSTDEVYGDGAEGVASHEGSVLEPTNPYAATKAGAEYLVKAYMRSFNLPCIITRGNNVYGPHQYPEKIIPKFINQLMRGMPMTLHGDGSNMRNYLYVEDVARAFDCILHKGAAGQIYNIGGKNEISNIQIAREILHRLGLVEAEGGLAAAEAKHLVRVGDRPFNDLRYPLDTTRLVQLGWREQVSWDEGMAATVDWFLKYSGNWPDIELALVAHPRRGWTGKAILAGKADDDEQETGASAGALKARARAGSLSLPLPGMASRSASYVGAGVGSASTTPSHHGMAAADGTGARPAADGTVSSSAAAVALSPLALAAAPSVGDPAVLSGSAASLSSSAGSAGSRSGAS